jgi:hypothetical protein
LPKKHTVAPGECIAQIAWQHGFGDPTPVWQHGGNSELRKKRPDPYVLMPGDVVTVPDVTPKTTTMSTGEMHKVVVRVPKKELRLCLTLTSGPLKGEKYKLEIPGQPPLEGSTDGDGVLKAKMPVGAKGGLLTIGTRRLRLRFGNLDPLPASPDEALTGVVSRLRNLGYQAPDLPDEKNPAFRSTLALLQSDEELDPTGQLDDATAQKLSQRHGC